MSAVRTNCPNLNFGVCFSNRSWRFEQISLFFVLFEASIGFIFVELWIVIFYFLTTKGNAFHQLASPVKKIGFCNRQRIVLKTRSAMDDPLSMNLENC